MREKRIFGVRWEALCLAALRFDGVSLPRLFGQLRKQHERAGRRPTPIMSVSAALRAFRCNNRMRLNGSGEP